MAGRPWSRRPIIWVLPRLEPAACGERVERFELFRQRQLQSNWKIKGPIGAKNRSGDSARADPCDFAVTLTRISAAHQPPAIAGMEEFGQRAFAGPVGLFVTRGTGHGQNQRHPSHQHLSRPAG